MINRFIFVVATVLLIIVCVMMIKPPKLIVTNDPGGSIVQRISEIESLRKNDIIVEIRGFCASSCTMLLTLPKTCVEPTAILAFHGPQSQFYGVELSATDFERWSQSMASYYPTQIRKLYLDKWRYTTVGTIQISVAEAIALGARSCN